MNKKAKLIILFALVLVCMLSVFTGCEMTYGNPDGLGIANMDIGQRILLGLQVALLGIGMVFVVLFALILIINLMKLLMVYINKLESKKQTNVEVQEEIQPIISQNNNNEEEETVAAIMAALTAFYDAQNIEYKSNLSFRVRSIKEIK
ncbi:MAG: OadG family protein [Clostridia bacterium]